MALGAGTTVWPYETASKPTFGSPLASKEIDVMPSVSITPQKEGVLAARTRLPLTLPPIVTVLPRSVAISKPNAVIGLANEKNVPTLLPLSS
jgi:hypothetical protein